VQADASPLGLQRALRGVAVGGLLLCLPMPGTDRGAALLAASQRRRLGLAAALLGHNGGVRQLPLAFWDGRQSLAETRRLHASDPLWDGLDLKLPHSPGTPMRPAVPLPTHAAVALQAMLFDYCGGWPNTFG